MTKINKISVQLVSAELAEDKKELTGKCLDRMIGVLHFNGMKMEFSVRNYKTDKNKSYNKQDEIDKIISEHTDVIVTENDDTWFIEENDVTVTGLDLVSLKSAGVVVDFSEIYAEHKKLQAFYLQVDSDLRIAKAIKDWDNSWFVQNLEMMNENVADGVVITIVPSKEQYIDPKNHNDMHYNIKYSYKGNVKEQSLAANFTSTDKYSLHSKFTGYALKDSYKHLGLFKSSISSITKINKEFDSFKKSVVEANKEQKQKQTRISKIQALFGNDVKSVVENEWTGTGRNSHSYEVEHFEVVFNVAKKKRTYNDNFDYFGTGIKFVYANDEKSFIIKAIAGNFRSVEDGMEFARIIMECLADMDSSKISMNMFSNVITSSGMSEIIKSFVQHKLVPIELSEYSWKTLKML